MSEALLLNPDRKFVERIIASGGGDLKQCYQCATCSVVCELSDGRTPFPRKEMIWAQWGLKDQLMADPDVWRCHQCNDCTTRCPRGARPGDVLAAVRQQAVRHYAVPRFLGSWANRVGYLPLMLLIPAVLLASALLVRGPLENMLPVGAPHGFYAEFFPHWLVIGFFSFFTGLAFLAAAVSAVRFWRAMEAADGSSEARHRSRMTSSILRTLKSIFSHDKFAKCTTTVARRSAHLLAFYGFMALFVVTVWAVTDIYVIPRLGIDSLYPFNLLHPMKILANLGAVVLIVGCVLAIAERVRGKQDAAANTSFDLIFVWLLLSVAITGVITEVLRFAAGSSPAAGLEYTAYAVYFGHLVLVFALLVYLPYSKFAHVLYRTVALVYAERSGRAIARHQLPSPTDTALLNDAHAGEVVEVPTNAPVG